MTDGPVLPGRDPLPESHPSGPRSVLVARIMVGVAYFLPLLCFGLSKRDDQFIQLFIPAAIAGIMLVVVGRVVFHPDRDGTLMTIMHSFLVGIISVVLGVAAIFMFGRWSM